MTLREWAEDTSRVIITEHAFDRVDERGTDSLDTMTVYRVLQTGTVFGNPVVNERGHWQATMPSGCQAGETPVL